MPPRNRQGYDCGRAVRAGVKAILVQHSPLRRPLRAKEIIELLPLRLRRRQSCICWHIRAIQEEAENKAKAKAQRRADALTKDRYYSDLSAEQCPA
jgi:hypothetical protein